jgi:hypothetical protein
VCKKFSLYVGFTEDGLDALNITSNWRLFDMCLCVPRLFTDIFSSFLLLCYVGVFFGLRVRCFSGIICISGVTLYNRVGWPSLSYIVSRL